MVQETKTCWNAYLTPSHLPSARKGSGARVGLFACAPQALTHPRTPSLHHVPPFSRAGDLQTCSADVQATLETLAAWAPGAASQEARDAVQLLLQCPEDGVERRATEVLRLGQEDQDKYTAAMRLGTHALLQHVENVVSSLVDNPGAVANLRIDSKKKEKGTFDPANPENHKRWRYSAYRALAVKLQLQGRSSIPLPLVCETLVKVCWPGPPKESYTNYVDTAGSKRVATEGECEEVRRDAAGNVILGTQLSPVKLARQK